MREIKFRAWDKIKKNMMHKVVVYDSKVVNGYNPFASGVEHLTFDPPTTILMQYTGLKDKNGKEIYFGDILQTSNDGKDGCDVWGATDMGYAVCYECPSKLGVCFKGWWPTDDDNSIFNFKYCEIIGNIWGHPDLIK